jgi:hypothetical protein
MGKSAAGATGNMFRKTVLIAPLLSMPLLALAAVPTSPVWVPITPQTQGVSEYDVTLVPTATPGVYTPLFTLLPLGSEFTSSLTNVPYTPGAGCFVAGGRCTSNDPSAFSFVQLDFSAPISGVMTTGTGGSFLDFLNGAGTVLSTVTSCCDHPGVLQLSPPWPSIVQFGGFPGAGASTFTSVEYSRSGVPEPGTLPLLAAAMSGLWFLRRRRKSARS